ncbi:hypothetical protein thsrh120_00630 [Rhizobium sp. No.120]
MIDELDQVGVGCSILCRHSACEEIDIQRDIVLDDDSHRVVARQKPVQRQQMAAIAAVFTGQYGAAVPPLETIVIYVDPFVAWDEGAVDTVDTFESKT